MPSSKRKSSALDGLKTCSEVCVGKCCIHTCDIYFRNNHNFFGLFPFIFCCQEWINCALPPSLLVTVPEGCRWAVPNLLSPSCPWAFSLWAVCAHPTGLPAPPGSNPSVLFGVRGCIGARALQEGFCTWVPTVSSRFPSNLTAHTRLVIITRMRCLIAWIPSWIYSTWSTVQINSIRQRRV